MNIAQGSLEECPYYLILARDLGYSEINDLMSQTGEFYRAQHVAPLLLNSDS